MTNAKTVKMPFGKAPKVENVTLPSIKSIADDNKVAAAIGSVGGGAGGVQRLMCSTAFYFGDMAKDKGVKDYTGDNFWSGFYSTHYAAKPLSEGSEKQAKSNCLVYVKVAQLPYDSVGYAQEMFEHPHGSMNQKATALRTLCKDHDKAPPSKAEWKAILPAAPVETVKTIADRATEVHTSLENVYKRRDKDDAKALWAAVNGNAALLKLYNEAVAATLAFQQMAETVINLKAKRGGKGKVPAAGKGAPEGVALN